MIQMEQMKDNKNSDSLSSKDQTFSSNNQLEKPLISTEGLSPANASNDLASSWHILSIFSWIVFLCTVFNIISGGLSDSTPKGNVFYVDSHLISFYILIISIIGLLIMIKRSAYDKDMNFMKSYFDGQSKFHSFGFLFAAGVFTCKIC